MKVAHLFAGGNIGGIECLCRDYIVESEHEHIILVMWGNGPILEELKKRGIKVIYLNLSSRSIISGICKIREICRQESVDVIVAQHEAVLSHIIITSLRAIKCPVKTIAYAHCHASFMCREKERKGLKFRRFVLSKSFARADCVVAISKVVADSLVDYLNVEKDKIEIIYNGIRYDTPDEKVEKVSDRKKKEIIYVGRLIKEKGVQTIIKAMSYLDDNYHLSVVGDGAYRTQLEELCADYKSRVTFCGFQNDVRIFLNKADVFVHVPECEEGFGLTVAEAMALGKICVVGNRGAMSEIVVDGDNGYLINSSDVQQLVNKLIYIFENINSDEMERIRQRAIEKASEYSIANYVRKLDSLLNTL